MAGAALAAGGRRGSARGRPQAKRADLKREHSATRGELAREHGDRGRTADHPAEIPPRGWKDILIRTYRSISEDRVLALAAGVTYYVLLALFPGIAALVSIYGLVANPADIGEMLANLAGTVPRDVIEIIRGQLTFLASQDEKALGFAFFGGLLASLWSANAAIKALFDALNVVYGEKEKRNFFRLTVLSLTFTAGMILFMVLALDRHHRDPGPPRLPASRRDGRAADQHPALAGDAGGRGAGPGGDLSLRPVPRRRAQWRWITWGSIAAALLWFIVSMLFSWYASNFGNYNKTYGSLGAVIAFMMWSWLSTTIVLMGGELNAEIEHQTAKDSTTGPPKPLGARGAKMADTVGAAQD